MTTNIHGSVQSVATRTAFLVMTYMNQRKNLEVIMSINYIEISILGGKKYANVSIL